MKKLNEFKYEMKTCYWQLSGDSTRFFNMKTIGLTLFLFISFNFFSQQCVEISTLSPHSNYCGDATVPDVLYINSPTSEPVTAMFTINDNNLGPYVWSASVPGTFTTIDDSTATFSTYENVWNSNLCNLSEIWIYATSSVDPTCVDSLLCSIWNEQVAFGLGSYELYNNSFVNITLNGSSSESLFVGQLINLPDTIFVDYCNGDYINISADGYVCSYDTYESGPIYPSLNEDIPIYIELTSQIPCSGASVYEELIISASNTNCCIDSSIIDFNAICTLPLQPVCGCNGMLYANPCEAYYYGGVLSFSNSSDCVEDCDVDYDFVVDTLDCNTIHFSGSGASNYYWQFGDEGVATGTNVSHTFSSNGTYSVSIWGYDVNFAGIPIYCDTLSFDITIDCCDINDNSIYMYSTCANEADNYVRCIVYPFDNVASFLYDFGDGTPITDYLGHWYTEIGTYEVCVYAINGFGDVCDSVCVDYDVTQIADPTGSCCMANFSYTQDNCDVQFTNMSEGNFDAMMWIIDGDTLYGNNPTMTFENPGTYFLCLQALNGGSYCDTMCREIYIEDCETLRHNSLEPPSMRIFPNPSTNLITIQLETILNNKFRIYDQQGREVMNGQLNGKNTEISIGKLSRGTYTIHVDGNYQPAVIIKE